MQNFTDGLQSDQYLIPNSSGQVRSGQPDSRVRFSQELSKESLGSDNSKNLSQSKMSEDFENENHGTQEFKIEGEEIGGIGDGNENLMKTYDETDSEEVDHLYNKDIDDVEGVDQIDLEGNLFTDLIEQEGIDTNQLL